MSILGRLRDKLTGGTLNDASAYIERGTHHLSEGNLQAALADFEKAVELSSTESEKAAAYFNRGRIHSRLQHWDAAITDFDQVALLAPAFGLAYLERGGCFGLKEDNDAAIADFDKAIALLPPGPEQAIAYCNRGSAYAALGHYQAALADIGKAIQIAPEFTPAYTEREKVQKRALDAESDASTKSLPEQYLPLTTEQYCERAWADCESNDLVRAFVYFSRAVEQSPYYHNAYYGRGVVNAKLRRYEQAAADLNKALELQPRFPAALAQRGLVHVETGDYEQGMRDYNKATEVDPTYAIAHINKGSLYALQEKWSDALDCLDEGIRLGPTPEAYFNRAAVCEQLGEYQRAIEDLRVFLQLRPHDRLAENARQRLKELEEKRKQH